MTVRVIREEGSLVYPMAITFTLNGTLRTVHAAPTSRFVDILRDDIGLTGTKVSCGIGRCGACTVLQNGQPVNACLLMAYQVDGSSILTIEGLAEDGQGMDADTTEGQQMDVDQAQRLVSDRPSSNRLHPLQQAFLDAGGFQCGYCTPGMILAAKALLDASPKPTEQQIREALSGNLCRCTGYTGILRAIELAVNRGYATRDTAIDMEGGDVH